MKVAILALLGNISAIQLAGPNSMVQTQSESLSSSQLRVQKIQERIQNLNQMQLNIEMNKDNKHQSINLIKDMKQEMLSLSNDVLLQSMEDDPTKVNDVTKWMTTISAKVPVVQGLQKRLDIMQGLDPIMDGILDKMKDVTDNTNLNALQSEQKALSAGYTPDKSISEIITSAASRSLNMEEAPWITAHSTKQAMVNNTMKTAMYDLEGANMSSQGNELQSKMVAVNAMGNAAALGTAINTANTNAAAGGFYNQAYGTIQPRYVPTAPIVNAPFTSQTTVVASSVAQTPAPTDSEAYNKAILASLAKAASAPAYPSAESEARTDSAPKAAAAAPAPVAAAPSAAPVAAVQQSKAPKSEESAKQSVTDVYSGMADFGATVDNIGEEQVLDSSL